MNIFIEFHLVAFEQLLCQAVNFVPEAQSIEDQIVGLGVKCRRRNKHFRILGEFLNNGGIDT